MTAEQRLCPACGTSAVLRSGCTVCDSTGLVSSLSWSKWRDRLPGRKTSTTTSVRGQLVSSLQRLRLRRTPQLEPLVTVGETLLATMDEWQSDVLPPLGSDRARAYQRVSDWLTATESILRGER